jgi:hypothetical protein
LLAEIIVSATRRRNDFAWTQASRRPLPICRTKALLPIPFPIPEVAMRDSVVSSLILLAAVLAHAPACAQNLPAGQGKIATNIAGVSAFDVPPATFNPLTATAVELAQYGFPPRPTRLLGADALARWQRRVRDQTRIVPELVQTNTFHGPVRTIKQTRTRPSVIEGTSENWSGIAIVDKAIRSVYQPRRLRRGSSSQSRRRAANRARNATARPTGSESTAPSPTTCCKPGRKPTSIAHRARIIMPGSNGIRTRK